MNAKEALIQSKQVREEINIETQRTVYERIDRVSSRGKERCYYPVYHLYREEVTALIKELREQGYYVSHDGFRFIKRPRMIFIRWGREEQI